MLHIIVHGGDKRKEIPEWMRSTLLDDENVIYVPAAFAGEEEEVFQLACLSHVDFIREFDHVYLPIGYLKFHYPDMSEHWNRIECSVKNALETNKTRVITNPVITEFADAKLAIMKYQDILNEMAAVLRKETKAEICGEEYHPEWVRDLLWKIESVGG
jgi:hypothetical protein